MKVRIALLRSTRNETAPRPALLHRAVKSSSSIVHSQVVQRVLCAHHEHHGERQVHKPAKQ